VSTRTPEDWGAEYSARLVKYRRFSDKLKALLDEMLELKGMDVIQVEARAKDPGHFVAKQRRKQYDDPFAQMTDIVGLRIIVYYVDDLDRVGELIAGEFAQDPANTHINRLTQAPDRFGYESDHYVVELSDLRAPLIDWAEYAGIKFEIQVRTSLQHAWGAISRKLAYQAEEEVPRELRRQLFRLSALLELADKEFADFRSSAERVFVARRDEVEVGELDAPVDASSLEAYLDVHPHERTWSERAAGLGYMSYEPLYDDSRGGNLSAVLHTLEREGVSRLQEVHGILTDAERWGEDVLRDVLEKTGDIPPTAVPIDMVHILILVGTGAADETVDDVAWYQELVTAVKEVIAERRS